MLDELLSGGSAKLSLAYLIIQPASAAAIKCNNYGQDCQFMFLRFILVVILL